jgi:two-component system, OmpR family, response regulator
MAAQRPQRRRRVAAKADAMRVLYVDDDRINTLLFVETCRFAPGLEVDTADSGAEALQRVAQTLPDVLVIDLHLPDTDGYALLAALRCQVPALAQAPAYLCTAEDSASVSGPARAAGYAGCWAKPVQLQAVLADLAALAARPSP